jgi:hypothetical protein
MKHTTLSTYASMSSGTKPVVAELAYCTIVEAYTAKFTPTKNRESTRNRRD